MEVKLNIELWQLVTAMIAIASAFAVNTYMTKQHDKKIKTLEDKTDGVMTETEARVIFVSKELYENQMNHIDKTLTELKEQNNTILGYVKK
ncbi:hypothetical protein [Poseidonibacter sp.]|uniref:hypothetical protein n=1 Tax=Poseidonibacter sp. TaxID=2321188 RepID=UPI003C743FE4